MAYEGGSSLKAVILAAGYATRLYPLTLNIPKPLLKVTGDKAVIDFIVDDLERSGKVDEVCVVTNAKFYGDFRRWAERRRSGARSARAVLTVLNDGTTSNADRLGAVGDMHYAIRRRGISGDCVVVGGDNLFDRGFGSFLSFARGKEPYASLALFDIGSRRDARRFGVVKCASDGHVGSFEEKPDKPLSSCVATCLYYFPARVLALLEKYIADKTTSKDAPGNFIRWLMEHDRVYGFSLHRGHWVDIGHFDSYKDVVRRYNGKV